MTKPSLVNDSLLSADMAKEIFCYDPNSGALTWKISRGQRAREGGEAGSINSDGYRYIRLRIDGKHRKYLAHRVAWLYAHGCWPIDQIDHINGVRSDNRISNLREANNSENQRNAKKRSNNKSGVLGVCWVGTRSKWRAYIQDNDKKRIYLGIYPDKLDAICARKSAENKYGYHPNHGRSVQVENSHFLKWQRANGMATIKECKDQRKYQRPDWAKESLEEMK